MSRNLNCYGIGFGLQCVNRCEDWEGCFEAYLGTLCERGVLKEKFVPGRGLVYVPAETGKRHDEFREMSKALAKTCSLCKKPTEHKFLAKIGRWVGVCESCSYKVDPETPVAASVRNDRGEIVGFVQIRLKGNKGRRP